jgi:hypothetical protein
MYQNTAQGIASLGRNNDSMLVHMTPREVGGLQHLAMAHGGSLTINPQTGLPEAGFLDSIIPIAATVVGSMYGMPWLGAAVSGGMNYMQTGNLGQSIAKGAMSYGLGQIGGSMMDAGASELAMKPEFANVGYQAAEDRVLSQLSNIPAAGNAAAPIYSPDVFGPSQLTIPSESYPQMEYGPFEGKPQPLNYPESLYGAGTRVPPSNYDMAAGNYPPGTVAIQPTLSPAPVAAPAPVVVPPVAPTIAAPVAPEVPGMRVYAAEPPTTGPTYKSVAQIKSESPWEAFKAGASKTYDKGLGAFVSENKTPLMMAGAGLLGSSMLATPKGVNAPPVSKGSIRPYTYSEGTRNPNFGKPGEPYYVGQGYTAQPIYAAAAGGLMDSSMVNPMQNPDNSYPTARIDQGGLMSFAAGGPATGSMYQSASTMFPDDPAKRPLKDASNNMLAALKKGAASAKVMAAAIEEESIRSKETGANPAYYDVATAAGGGLMGLSNEYAAGGQLLQGPGDGMSDSIPAVIKGDKPQRAALAQGEFVVPADVVSHLGNGSTDAGAKRLYSMMDKVRHARTGNKKQGRQINPDNFMPA